MVKWVCSSGEGVRIIDGDHASLGHAWEIGWAANVDGGNNRESPV